MATQYITHKCGHTQEHRMPLNKKSWDWAIAQKEKEVCSECWKSEQALNPPTPIVKFRACSEGVEVVITNAFVYKDQLKERGYHFAYVNGGLTNKGTGANLKAFAYNSDEMIKEIAWLKDQGWIDGEIVIEQGFNPLAAIGEGREDLIDAKVVATDIDIAAQYDKYRSDDQDLSGCVSEKQAAYTLVCKKKVINIAQQSNFPVEDIDLIHVKFPKLCSGNWWIDASKSNTIAKLTELANKAKAK